MLDFIGKLNEDRRPLVFVTTTALADDRLLQVIKDRVIYCFHQSRSSTKSFSFAYSNLFAFTSAKRKKRTTSWLIYWKARLRLKHTRAIGVPAHLKGYYYYLRDAIRIYAMSGSPVGLSITNDIYPTVAKIYNTRPPLVEHAMRNAIEIAWTRGNAKNYP